MVEIIVTMAILTLLVAAGAGMMGDNGPKSRKATSDLVTGMVEQGRSRAITSHSQVMLAIAEPRDLPFKDSAARLGLFKLSEFDAKTGRAKGEMLRRWEMIPGGVAIIGGDIHGLRNLMDAPRVELTYQSGGRETTASLRGIVFTTRGGRDWPAGSGPMVVRIAEGGYRGDLKEASANKRDGKIPEDFIKIGRVIARPQRFDP